MSYLDFEPDPSPTAERDAAEMEEAERVQAATVATLAASFRLLAHLVRTAHFPAGSPFPGFDPEGVAKQLEDLAPLHGAALRAEEARQARPLVAPANAALCLAAVRAGEEMRRLQRDYFRTRLRDVLIASKAAEKAFDDAARAALAAANGETLL